MSYLTDLKKGEVDMPSNSRQTASVHDLIQYTMIPVITFVYVLELYPLYNKFTLQRSVKFLIQKWVGNIIFVHDNSEDKPWE